MNSTGETMDLQISPLSRALANRAGPQLQRACSEVAPLQGGEIKITPGFQLPCRMVLHCRVKDDYNGVQSAQVYCCSTLLLILPYPLFYSCMAIA